jgi:magnesium-transporting ATPase (P-type)
MECGSRITSVVQWEGIDAQGRGMTNDKIADHRKDDHDRPWHALDRDEVLSVLEVGEEGLSRETAEQRLEEHGPNELPSEEKAGPVQRFLRQFKNILIFILIAAAVLAAILGEWVDTAVIAAVVLINALIGFIQEGKAERAMESIREMLSPQARVLRDGEEQELDAELLVPGDIVLLESGDRVPADLRVLEARNVQAEEAALTGESEPVSKQVEPVEEDAPLGDRKCMAYSSTVLTSGKMRGVVVATGAEAEIGRISGMVSEVKELSTPLLRKVDTFGRWLSLAIVLLGAVVFALGYFLRGFAATEMFLIVVSLAVAAIPEGLPAIMTITLALGVQRMARRNAIVRKLPAVETLGSVTVICSDKTGTLTRNEMTVAKVATGENTFEVGGVGYAPEGEFSIDGEEVDPGEHSDLLELARAGMLASDATVREEEGEWSIDGMPTEGAVVVLAHKAGMDREGQLGERPRKDVIPFESERQYMASLHEEPENGSVLYVKGAPERMLELCSTQRSRDGEEPLDRELWEKRQEELAAAGHRVLAIAARQMDGKESLDEEDVGELTMLGLVGIIDPPREEAIEAIKEARRAGIEVKMITGDHVLTARSVAESMGIGDGEHAISGKDLEHAGDEELVSLVLENDVFARSSPEHKLRMIKALQSKNQVVAMTGDGVNDAPALKRADVGVAMGVKGSEAAKEAAEMVLADDNFATIERAVKEGRTIYDNLIKTIMFILPTNGAQSLLVIVSALFLFDVMPVTPIQILWVNMVTAVTLALALSFEPPEAGLMSRPPRPPDEPIINRYLFWRILFVSVLIAGIAILFFTRSLDAGFETAAARTMAVNALVAGQLFYLFNSRFITGSALGIGGIFGNSKVFVAIGVLVVLQLAFTYLGIAHTLLGTAAIPVTDWLWILAAGLAVFLLVEMEKGIMRWREGRTRAT